MLEVRAQQPHPACLAGPSWDGPDGPRGLRREASVELPCAQRSPSRHAAAARPANRRCLDFRDNCWAGTLPRGVEQGAAMEMSPRHRDLTVPEARGVWCSAHTAVWAGPQGRLSRGGRGRRGLGLRPRRHAPRPGQSGAPGPRGCLVEQSEHRTHVAVLRQGFVDDYLQLQCI